MKSKITSAIRRIDLHKFKRLKQFLIKSIIVGLFILTILFFKKINLRYTNSFLDITKRWTEHEFSITKDGKKIFGSLQKTLENSVEVFNEYNPIKKEYDSIPIDGKIISPYKEGTNSGIDIRVKENINEEPISITNGIVTEVELRDKKGYFVTITYEDKEFIYGYFSNTNLSRGDQISSGEPIGELGTNKDGFKYLRIEIWEDGSPIDPIKYIDIK